MNNVTLFGQLYISMQSCDVAANGGFFYLQDTILPIFPLRLGKPHLQSQRPLQQSVIGHLPGQTVCLSDNNEV